MGFDTGQLSSTVCLEKIQLPVENSLIAGMLFYLFVTGGDVHRKLEQAIWFHYRHAGSVNVRQPHCQRYQTKSVTKWIQLQMSR